MAEFHAYVGLDVHKDSIAVAIAEAGRDGEVRRWGVVRNTPEAVAKLARRFCCIDLLEPQYVVV